MMSCPDIGQPLNPAWWHGAAHGDRWMNPDGHKTPANSRSSNGTSGQPVSSGDDGEENSGNGSGSAAPNSSSVTYSRSQDVAEGSSSAEDRIGGAAADRISLGDGCSESSQPLPTLRKDGPVINSGSTGHPESCKPCAFYCFSLRGCRNGVECAYCHLFHESKLRQRREEWKKSQCEKRGKQRQAQRNNTSSEQEAEACGETKVGGPDAGSAEIPTEGMLVPKVAYTIEEVAAPSRIHGAQAPQHAPQGGVAVGAAALPPSPSKAGWCGASRPVGSPVGVGGEPAAGRHAHVLAPAVPEARQRRTARDAERHDGERHEGQAMKDKLLTHSSLTQGSGGVTIGRGIPKRSQQQPPPIPQPQRQVTTLAGLDAGLPPHPVDVFTYTPNTAVIGVGQTIELWPPVHIASAQMVFAVSPELPKGLMLDERMGLVHGTALEATLGMVKYYIMACEPGDTSLRVKMSVIDLGVMANTPSRKTKNISELKWANAQMTSA
mmetsp:Transcript_6422/g.18821  ORF Transcript_6422/g.18821 Transcript_6422/m.18821 type:complete len:492 (+) Transcript_6422:184-1659(+)